MNSDILMFGVSNYGTSHEIFTWFDCFVRVKSRISEDEWSIETFSTASSRIGPRVRFKNTYELLNLRAFKYLTLYKYRIL